MEKIWLKQYHNIPAEINVNTYQNIIEIFDESCKQYSRLPALTNMGVTLSYQEVCEKSRILSAYLQNGLNLKKGDRVAIMMPNVLQYPVVVWAILRAGLVVVNVNPLYTPTELIHQTTDAEVDTIIVLANFAHTVEKALPETPLKNIIVTELGDLFPWPKSLIVNSVVKYLKRMIRPYNSKKFIKFNDAMAAGKQLKFNSVPLNHEDIAFLQYTGGTTGVAKGAMLTHKNMVANILQAEAWLKPLYRPGKEVMITALPLYHIFSLMSNCLFIMRIGGHSVLITNPRDVNSMITDMSKVPFSIITGVNTLFIALLKNPRFTKLDFSHLVLSLGGGMAVQSAVAEKWAQVTGKPLLEAYGLTETSPCVTINPPDLQHYNGTIGLPVSSTEICILDEDGNELEIDEAGELAVKGPQVMRGYWRQPKETEKVFTKSGWLLTGDIASVNSKGYVKLLERKKDMILVSGFNVYPNEIEDVLVSMPGIREAAVVAVPDENSGEVPKAFIVRDDAELTEQAIITFCRTKLTGYKIPKYVKFCEELPKSYVGKVLRRALRTPAAP